MRKRLYVIIGIISSVIAAVLAGLLIYNAAITDQFNKQLDLGNQYLAEKNYQEAISAFKKAMELKPKRPEPYVNLAKIYIILDKYDEAVKILTAGEKYIGYENLADFVYKLESEILAASGENTETEIPAQVVQFKDEVLERIVRNGLNAGTREIYNTKLMGIETVTIDGSEKPEEVSGMPYDENTYYHDTMKITSITGNGKLMTLDDFKSFPNLRHLTIRDQNIIDISPLEELTKLKLLTLESFLIDDISP